MPAFRRAAAHHRRRRDGQDQHARASRRASVISRRAPERILLLTFTRRAAAEMTPAGAAHRSRPEMSRGARSTPRACLVRHVSLDRQPAAAHYAHGAGARAVVHRARPRRRGGSAGLRAPRSSGSRRRRSAFRARTRASRSTRTASTRSSRCERRSKRCFPGALTGKTSSRNCSAPTSRRKQRATVLDYDDLLLYWHVIMQDAALRARSARALRSRAGRRVPGHEHAAGRDPARD